MFLKSHLALLALACASAACQPQAASAPAAALAPTGPAAATPSAAKAADTTATMLDLLRRVDLTAAWRGAPNGAMDGFYGPDNYRISFRIDTVRRDEHRPNVFYFEGRDRYKRTITPFTGTLTVTRLAPLPDTVELEHRLGNRAYSAFASFVLREDSTAKGSGHCTGRAVLDFQVNTKNQAAQASFGGVDSGWDNPTRGCGQVFRGVWQDNRTGQRKPVAWATYYWVIVPEVLSQLGLGERSEGVNPELARYGWNTIMENDEWWAKSPKPGLSL
jgi:hypothetical protein